jgi:glutathione synthase/RimK-type ligase-like ATP-grasp enzyme
MYKIRIASRHPSHKEIIRQNQMPLFPKRVRVRFGSTKKHRKCDIEFNDIFSIKNTSNKVKMKNIFALSGVNTPKYLVNNHLAREKILNGYLGDEIFFKTTFHSRGRGMKVIKKDSSDLLEILSLSGKGYFEKTEPSIREFRVHVMDGTVFYVDEKRPRDKSIKVKDRAMIKNKDSGFKFRRPLKDFPEGIIEESIKAVECLCLDFGAVDIGLNDSGVWVYEVNSAPSLRTKTRKLYQKALVRLIWKKILGSDNVEEIDKRSMDYNIWLDEQPLTKKTKDL